MEKNEIYTVERKGFIFKISVYFKDSEGNTLYTITLPDGRQTLSTYFIRDAWNAVRFFAAYMTKGV